MDRVALFVDGAAMFYAQRDNGWHIDFKSVHEYFIANRDKAGAWYFTAYPPVGEAEKLRKYRGFKNALTYIGYNVVDKEVKVIYDKNTGQVKLKGNLDIELVFKMLALIENYDIAVLLGGDSDYVPIINHLVDRGKQVIVVGRQESTGVDLRNAATKFMELEDLRERIEKRRR